MFNKIHFLTNESDISFSNHDLNISSSQNQYPSFDSNMLEHSLEALNSEFMIHGTSKYLLELPMNELHKKNLIYLQSFSYLKVDSSYYTCRRNYASYLLLYTYEGSGSITYEGQTYPLECGDVFLIDCMKEHYYCTTGDFWTHSDLHFFGGNASFIYNEFFQNQVPVFHLSSREEHQKILENILFFHTSASFHREMLVSTKIEELLLYILTHNLTHESSRKIPDSIHHLLEYIESNFSNPITLEDLSAFSNISKYHLCREFKKYTAFSPMEYLTELRLSKAKLLLMNTTIPSYKIGMLVGIPNEANFIRLFKNKNAMTPGDFRKHYT